jgi:hypothetical protein
MFDFNGINVKVKDVYEYDRDFVKAHTSSDYISPTGSIFPDDSNTKSFHKYEKSEISGKDAQSLYNELLKIS